MFKRINFRLQKKYFAFFTIVPLLLVTAVVKVPCPVCDGTGDISSTGMGQVTILKTDSSLVSVGDVQGCLNYRVYVYNVVVTLQNAGIVDGAGYVRVGLIDYTTSRVLATQYNQVYVPAKTQASNAFQSVFTVALDSPTTTLVQAETVLTSTECKACSGTGKVALNNLLFARGLKKSILESQRVAVSAYTPQIINPGDMPEELVGQEGNTDWWYIEHPEGP